MELKSEFNKLGYCFLRNVLEEDERLRIENDVFKIIEDQKTYSKKKDFTYEKDQEGNSFLKRFQNQWKYSDSLLQSLGNPKILDAAWQIYGKEMVPTAESLVINSPGKNSGFEWHQDGYGNIFIDKDRGMNIGVYLNDSTELNGAVHVIPESHLRGKIDLGKMLKDTGFKLEGSLKVEISGGDSLIHSRSLAHGSPANSSNSFRMTSYYGFIHRSSIRDIYSNDQINKRMNLIAIGVEARRESKIFCKEVSFDYMKKLEMKKSSNYKSDLNQFNHGNLLSGF